MHECDGHFWVSVEFNFGGWTECKKCGWRPTEDEFNAYNDAEQAKLSTDQTIE